MKRIFLLVPLLLVVVFLSACSGLNAAFESGDISLVSSGEKYHGDITDPPIVPITIRSTFDTQKLADISTQGVTYQCLLEPNTDSTCQPVKLAVPGVFTISASVSKLSGDRVTSSTKIEWIPYSGLDKLAQSIVGGEGKDPALGYAFGIAVLVVIVTLLLSAIGAKMTNGNPQGLTVGALTGFFTSLILLAISVYSNASPGLAFVVVGSIVVIIFVTIIALIIINATNRGYTVTTTNTEIHGFDQKGNQITAKFNQPFFFGPGENAPNTNPAALAFSNHVAENGRRLITGENRYDPSRTLED